MSETMNVTLNGMGGEAPFQTAARAARDGASDAREAAERFATSARLFAARFVYTTCYTVSYGVVFTSVLVARSVPKENAAVRGLIDGCAAARERVDALAAPAAATA